MTRRLEQVASSIERAVREVFSRGFHDPRIAGLITITGVRVTGDLQTAYIGISVLPAEKQSLTLHALNDAAAHIRREAGDLIEARTLPRFEFRADDSLKKELGVLQALERAKSQSTAPAQPPQEPPRD